MSDELRRMRDEAALLGRSIDDARAEHALGELDDASLAAIESRDGARLAELRAAIGELPAGTSQAHVAPGARAPAARGAATRRPRRSRLLVASCATALAVALAVIAVVLARPFAPTPPTLQVAPSARVTVLLVAAESALASGHPLQALTAYDAVRRLDPTNTEAMIESGWLRYEAALGAHDAAQAALGAAELKRAVAVAPNEAAAHLYYGIVLYQRDHDVHGALAQLRRAASLPESSVEGSLTAEMLALVGSKG